MSLELQLTQSIDKMRQLVVTIGLVLSMNCVDCDARK